MTREDIIKLAQACGHWSGQTVELNDVGLERFAALVIAEKEKQIITKNAPEIERINTYIKELEEALVIGREKVAQWMMTKGYATGHGDSIEDLLKELEWQIRESEREACAKVCEEITNELSNWPPAYDVVTAETKFIRGIGEMLGRPFVEAIRARK